MRLGKVVPWTLIITKLLMKPQNSSVIIFTTVLNVKFKLQESHKHENSSIFDCFIFYIAIWLWFLLLSYNCREVRQRDKSGPNISTTPLRQWGFRQCLSFSWTTLRDEHCRHPIAVMGVVDMFGQVHPRYFMETKKKMFAIISSIDLILWFPQSSQTLTCTDSTSDIHDKQINF